MFALNITSFASINFSNFTRKIKDWEARLMEDEQKDTIGRVIPNNASLPVLSRLQSETIIYKKPE